MKDINDFFVSLNVQTNVYYKLVLSCAKLSLKLCLLPTFHWLSTSVLGHIASHGRFAVG